MTKRLTETFVKTLKPPAAGSRLIWDDELTGFAVKIYAPPGRTLMVLASSCCRTGAMAASAVIGSAPGRPGQPRRHEMRQKRSGNRPIAAKIRPATGASGPTT